MRKIAPGIRQDAYGYQVYCRVDGQFRSRRFPASTTLTDLKKELRLLRSQAVTDTLPEAVGRAFADEAEDYLELASVQAMPTYKDRAYRIRRWVEVFGDRDRSTITALEIEKVLTRWRKDGGVDGGPLAPATLNQFTTALQALYTKLDGKSAANIVKDVHRFDESEGDQDRSHDLLVLARVIRRTKPWGKTRRRLRFLLWSGWPHKLLKQIKAEDIDWQGGRVRVARRRKGKGMKAEWVPLIPRAMLALRRLVDARGLGAFSNSSMHSVWTRALEAENAARAARGLPQLPHIRVYDLRHSNAAWAAGVIKDNSALVGLLRTNLVQRYSRGSAARRMEEARNLLAASRHRG